MADETEPRFAGMTEEEFVRDLRSIQSVALAKGLHRLRIDPKDCVQIVEAFHAAFDAITEDEMHVQFQSAIKVQEQLRSDPEMGAIIKDLGGAMVAGRTATVARTGKGFTQ